MGNADRRNSRKMLQRRSQAAFHARAARRAQEAAELRKAGKKVKKPMFSPAPVKAEEPAPVEEAPAEAAAAAEE